MSNKKAKYIRIRYFKFRDHVDTLEHLYLDDDNFTEIQNIVEVGQGMDETEQNFENKVNGTIVRYLAPIKNVPKIKLM
jgi:hypothetical protein